MNPSLAARAALTAALGLTLAGCVENSYRSKASHQPGPAPVASRDVAPAPAPAAPAASATPTASPDRGPDGDAPAIAHQGPAQAEGYTLEGYRVYADEGRLWVFAEGSENLRSYLEKGEPAKRVTLIGEGPHGKTLLGSDTQVMRDYALAARSAVDGFTVIAREGRLWVFRDGSEDLHTFRTKGEPAKRVTLIGEGPGGITLLGSDTEAMKSYADAARFAVPGFAVLGDGGRLWVFKKGSSDHASFLAKGEPAKRVTLIGAGPDGRTLMGAEKAVLEDFAASHRHATPGFVVIGDDGRLWVFRSGSEHLASFVAKGEPAKRVTLIGAGPDGATLLGADKATMQAFARAAAN